MCTLMQVEKDAQSKIAFLSVPQEFTLTLTKSVQTPEIYVFNIGTCCPVLIIITTSGKYSYPAT